MEIDVIKSVPVQTPAQTEYQAPAEPKAKPAATARTSTPNTSVDKMLATPDSDQFKVITRKIEQANRRMVGANTMFQYGIHEATNQIMVKVMDKETNELLLEIPPEKVLDAIAKMWELAGLFVDEKR
jgi:flagellar protein FlaG